MKKFIMIAALLVAALNAQAQTKGDFAVGLQGGATISKLEIGDWNVDDTSTRMGFGVFGQYNFTNNWRVELEGIYHPKKDHVSDFTLGLNIHYLFKIGNTVSIYPLLGYALSFVNAETYTETDEHSSVTVEGDNSTEGGIQLGAGVQANINSNWFVAGEYKYQPGIFGDGHVVMVKAGYRF